MAKQERNQRIRVIPSIIFTLVGALILGFAVFAAKDFPPRARIAPWSVGITTLILCIALLVSDIRAALKGRVKRGSGQSVDVQTEYDMASPAVRKRFIRVILWLAALYAGVWLVGFKIAVTSFFLAYLTIEARISWLRTLVLVGIAVLFLVYFDMVLQAYWPEGMLKQWLPWLPS